MSDNESEKIGKTPWRKIVRWVLLVWAIYFVLTGGGIGVGIFNNASFRTQSDPEVFPGCKLFIRFGDYKETIFGVPFLFCIFHSHYAQDIRIIINNTENSDSKESSGEYFALRISKITFDSSPENTVFIDQIIKLSDDVRVEYIDLSNAFPKDKSVNLVRLYGTVESEKLHDAQEFVVEYKFVKWDVPIAILPGWKAIIIGMYPPGLWFLEWIFPS